MIDLSYIKSFFPAAIANEARFSRYMLKEYLQLMVLDYLSSTTYIRKLSFIGGTNLRLIQGIDRFSEDLDFDCKGMDEKEFEEMTDGVVGYLKLNNIQVETRDKKNPKLTAYRRNLYFPELLFDLGLTGHREERFLIKVEAQDQGLKYEPEVVTLNRMGFFFNLQVPPMDILCAMKLSAVLSRQKGRDFYDSIFLLSKTRPNYNFLNARCGISSLSELKLSVKELLEEVDLNKKMQDFKHLLFNETNAERVLQFGNIIESIN